MKTARQFGIVMLLLVSYMVPAMACMVSGAQMTPVERACCQAMHNQCGQMSMEASQNCCQKTSDGVHANALDTKAFSLHPIATATWTTASAGFHPEPIVAGWVEHADYSPPLSPPGFISVLRI